ncbi:pantothenate kinase 2-like [Iris pallida]|uniref:Pantothenate kinase 2-like n=1 Tax=Iris pallida TaxID=29817 RepID=A0AAX6HBK3_IRIPA|nr:pantothenate kinase 2-like [Iris pallida]
MINIEDGQKDSLASVPRMVVENGCGSPCIDLRQVSLELAAAAKDADLIILEGMGRSLHTNYNAHFKCYALKLAMVKNQRLAEKLISGKVHEPPFVFMTLFTALILIIFYIIIIYSLLFCFQEKRSSFY